MGPPPGDRWHADMVDALKKQAATQVLLDAVVAKDKKEREAVKRMAAEEQREEMVTVLGAPAAKRQAKKRAAPAKKTPAEKAAAAEAKAAAGGEGHALWEMQGNEEVHARAHLRAQRLERRFCKDCGGSGLCEQHGRRRDRCKD